MTSALVKLAPCRACAPYVISGRTPPGAVCTECAAWDYSSRVLLAPAPAAYPFENVNDITPAPLEFEYLIKAVTVVYDKMRHTDEEQRWTTAAAVSLMETLKIPEKVRARILEVAADSGAERWFPSNWLSGQGPCAVLQANHIPEAMHLWPLGAFVMPAFVAVAVPHPLTHTPTVVRHARRHSQVVLRGCPQVARLFEQSVVCRQPVGGAYGAAAIRQVVHRTLRAQDWELGCRELPVLGKVRCCCPHCCALCVLRATHR